MTAQVTDKQAYQFWYDFLRSFNAGLEVDPFESQADKLRRIRRLEADPEKWFKYYFKKFYTPNPRHFQCEATGASLRIRSGTKRGPGRVNWPRAPAR